MNDTTDPRPDRQHHGGATIRGCRLTAATVAAFVVLSMTGAGALARSGTGTADCPGEPGILAPDPALTTSTTADLDGDGVRQFVALGPRDGDAGRTWVLASGAPSGGLVTAELADAGPDAPLRLTGPSDVDGDGDEEVLITSRMGAYTDSVQVWGLRRCAWVPVTTARSTTPTGFLVGASVMHGAGVRCTYAGRHELESYQSERIGETGQHRLTVSTFVWSDLHLTPAGPDRTLVVSDDELLAHWPSRFACGRPTGALLAAGAPSPAPAPQVPSPALRHPAAPPAKAVRTQPQFTG